MEHLDGLVAVVTGAGRGIGRAIALAMAGEGAAVVVSSRTRSELNTVVKEIGNLGSSGLAVEADAMVRDRAKDPVRRAVSHFGRIDILVNNVGGGVLGDQGAFTHDDDTFEASLILNLTSAYWTTREALPHMRDQAFGRVLTIGSGYAKRSGGAVAYTTAKHGLIGFTRALAAQVADYGITVNCLCPGMDEFCLGRSGSDGRRPRYGFRWSARLGGVPESSEQGPRT